MAQLNQLLAVIKSRKNELNKTITNVYHIAQKKPLFEGIEKRYRPRDEDGEQLPAEQQKLQADTAALLKDVHAAFTSMFATAGAIDKTNAFAQGDVYIAGVLVIEKVPVTHLLWLEKQLTDLRTVVQSMPTLDPQHDWVMHDEGGWASQPRYTTRSKKVPRNHVKAEATDKHPAQVEVYYEDTIVGDWTTVLRSGAMRNSQVRLYVERINLALEGVKKAREEANSQQVVDFTAAPILDYIFQ